MNDEKQNLDLLDSLIGMASKAGADAADAVFVEGVSLSLGVRLGKQEHLERSEGADIGLRVFVGQRQSIVSSSDTSDDALQELVERAIAMARSVPEDEFTGLADPSQLATEFPDLEICDDEEPATETLNDRAKRAEEAALAVPGITNSEGANASWGFSRMAVAASNGFARARSGSRHSISASVLAGTGTEMERDYDYASTVYGEDLTSPEDIGRSAGEKTIRRLNARKAQTASVPVLYDPRVANSLVGHLASAINGSSVARGTTFLKDKLTEKIFTDAVTIVDDPRLRRGLRSKSFDAEGVATQRREIIKDGVLTTWILDLRSARQLALGTTGHASRGTSSPPSPSTTNLYMQAGSLSPEELMADIKDGLYITELMGMGVNGVTGDYSRGASGFWIENGTLAYPVNEVTIAGNLTDMFAHSTAADDLEFRYGTNAPTLRVDGMTVAGR
ncbi:MAG: metallopeptidase TldD-related protein [Proteobacteria bacterium]|nr:metallopeptidase TldD-related protein [Pseudomonadota bacterium]MDA1022495.1 metallopeptidase TldD-related protein [Pseudomonadota bacterium]